MKTRKRRRVRILIAALMLVALAALPLLPASLASATTTIVYVNAAATGANTGTSWTDAFTDLQSALTAAVSGTDIWVAAGTYKPSALTDPADPRSATFTLVNGVAIYGGFAGTETSREQRNWQANATALSGDIGVAGVSGDNSYHVAVGSNTDSSAILDGFNITNGFASAEGSSNSGGGMYNDSGSPTVNNITFSGNFAEFGGGMVNFNSNPTLTNVIFSTNHASDAVGGMVNFNSNPTLTNVTFSGNVAGTHEAGGMFNSSSSPTLINVIFAGNSAREGGGGMTNSDSSPTLINVIFTTNYAYGDQAGYTGGGGMENLNSNPTLTNVIFSTNHANDSGGGMVNFNSSPTLANVTFSGNSAREGGGMYNHNSNPAVGNSILWGNVAPSGAQVWNGDPASVPTISYSLVQGSHGSGSDWDTHLGTDGGHNLDADPLFVNAQSGDLHLRASSPSINAGSNTYVPQGVTTDLDGNPRIYGGETGIVDLGAYEFQDALPQLNSIANQSANEGAPFSVSGSFTDPDEHDAWTATVDYGDGLGVQPLAVEGHGFTLSHAYADNGSYTVTITVTDSHEASASTSFTVDVSNLPPAVGRISAPTTPLPVGSNVEASAPFTDPGTQDGPHQATWDWGNGTGTTAGIVTEANGSGSVTGSHSYSAAGVYEVTLTVIDKDGASSQSIFQYVVVYAPTAGFTTGAGWIESLAGYYQPEPNRSGRLHFGFQVRYHAGRQIPEGSAQFRLFPGNITFEAKSFDWLVIGGSRAQFQGHGTLNDTGNYTFFVTVLHGSPDKFRLKIWDPVTNGVIYDNQPGTADNADPTTPLGAGQVQVHTNP